MQINFYGKFRNRAFHSQQRMLHLEHLNVVCNEDCFEIYSNYGCHLEWSLLDPYTDIDARTRHRNFNSFHYYTKLWICNQILFLLCYPNLDPKCGSSLEKLTTPTGYLFVLLYPDRRVDEQTDKQMDQRTTIGDIIRNVCKKELITCSKIINSTL